MSSITDLTGKIILATLHQPHTSHLDHLTTLTIYLMEGTILFYGKMVKRSTFTVIRMRWQTVQIGIQKEDGHTEKMEGDPQQHLTLMTGIL